jgi:hypothetical protein
MGTVILNYVCCAANKRETALSGCDSDTGLDMPAKAMALAVSIDRSALMAESSNRRIEVSRHVPKTTLGDRLVVCTIKL